MSMDKPYYNPEIWGGIECTINRVNNEYFDQLEYSQHYSRPLDVDAIADLKISKIRYPILWEKHQPLKNCIIDWTWTEYRLNQLKNRQIDVIAGLVHHGSGPAFTNMLDPHFPELLASYAAHVAQKFPWINYYTPVNEPLTTARFSGLYGLWYPHHKKSASFFQMLLNELKGTVLSMAEIRKINPRAQLIQTEDLGKTYSSPSLKYQARYENERRWLTFDILCGRFDEKHRLWKDCIKSGIEKKQLEFFLENPCVPDYFGFNHYLTSERYLDERLEFYPVHTHGGNHKHKYADVEAVRVELEEESGLEVLIEEAWKRYKQPIVISEVHLHCHREEQLRWFRHVWEAVTALKSKNVDIRAITSWALLGSFGWNKLLTQPGGDYEPGAFDVRSGAPRPTALARLIQEITHTGKCSHPLSFEKGWWERSDRLIYRPSIKPVRLHSVKKYPPVLIIGKNGTLGRAFARACEDRCITYQLIDRNECDISNTTQITSLIDRYKPWSVINAAGYVKVDEAEKNADKCFRDNTNGAHLLAIACKKKGIQFITFSSDLVFDGKKSSPYIESDVTNPLNIYGQSKAQAESLILKDNPSSLIVRTSAFFGPWDEYNFAYYIHKSLLQEEEILVASDVFISPTYVPDLVHTSLDILIDKETGIWHLANKGALSWSDFAFSLADGLELNPSLIKAVPSCELNYSAQRPPNSVLSSEKGHLLPDLENALERYFHAVKTDRRKVA